MREQHIHTARVYLAMARHFRLRDGGSWWPVTLLNWAANQRRKAAAEPAQREMWEAA